MKRLLAAAAISLAVICPQQPVWSAENAVALPKEEMRRSTAELRELAKQGEKQAARLLVDRYIIGSGRETPDIQAAQSALREFAPLLSDSQLGLRRYLIDAATATSSLGSFQQIARGFEKLSDKQKPLALRRLLQINQNAYVYVVQHLLAETGDFDGAPSGQLTTETIDAINRFCAAAEIECARGPLRRATAEAIGDARWRDRAGSGAS